MLHVNSMLYAMAVYIYTSCNILECYTPQYASQFSVWPRAQAGGQGRWIAPGTLQKLSLYYDKCCCEMHESYIEIF